MKRKSLTFFRCAARAVAAGWWYSKGDAYFHAMRYLRKHQNIKGLRPHK